MCFAPPRNGGHHRLGRRPLHLPVRVNDGLWLDGDYWHPKFFWEADGRFAFLRRKA
ncbi:MAG: hypothetical protein WAL59_15595 [Roseiarcus sp.]